MNGNAKFCIQKICNHISLHLLEKLVEWKPGPAMKAAEKAKALHLLEKLVEWKRFVRLRCASYFLPPLHLLEKLVEWKLVIALYSSVSEESLHLLEKLVEWKPSAEVEADCSDTLSSLAGEIS